MNGGDLTRSTFRAHRHYSGVRMQQGRVQLDADWNEQLDLTAHRDRAEVSDVIGTTGVPKVGGGFEVTVSPDGQDLLLSPGRAWVGGLLCEVDDETTAVLDTPSSTSVQVTSLVLDGAEVTPGAWVEVASAAKAVVARATGVDVTTRTVTLDTSVGGLHGDLTLRRRPSYASQPDLPRPDLTAQASATDPRVLDLPDGTWLAYLDVWERAVTALDDPTISEPALGVDTATRSRVVWQLRLLDLADEPGPVGCDTDLSTALRALAPPTGLMAARAEPPSGSADLCRPTPAGGYVGLENQLYRVHVHDVDGGRPVILWSRENASVVTAWVSTIAADVLEVADIGRDAVLGFKAGDWVELYDDTCTLEARPGTLVRLLGAKEDRLTLDPTTPTGSTDIADFPLNPRVRRWDSPGPVTVTDDGWVELENGVQVSFPVAGGTYRRHDYWLVPARSVLADVDWPRDSGGGPLPLPPAGIHHDLGRLAIVSRTGAGVSVTDCRDRFPALTALEASDVAVDNDTCELPGVETVQDAIDALCRSHDLRRHNRLLHGYGIVCGLAVECGGDEPADAAVRRFVTVQPGAAIDPDGYDLELIEAVQVDVLSELAALGDDVLDEHGDGEICLVLRNDLDRGPVVAATTYQPAKDGSWLQGTLLHDVYDDCIANLLDWVRAQLTPPRSNPDDQRAYLLRTALTNLLTYVANPRSGGTVFVSENEHAQLLRFYDGLKKRLRSRTFCAMFDDARPYPDYPDSLLGIRTIAGSGMHSRARMHPGGDELWTIGGGINPLQPSTLVNRYRLSQERLMARFDPVSGKEVEPGQKGSTTTDAVSDVAFSPDGRLVYAAVPTRDGNDTLLIVGDVGDRVTWRPAVTICGVKLVTLATTAADPGHVYAVGLRRTKTEGKAISLREYTGAGIWRIPARDVPDDLGPIPATAGMNTVGHLTISPKGQAVFTCGQRGGTAERYDRIAILSVPALTGLAELQLDGSGQDDVALVLATEEVRGTTAWVVVGSGRDRQVVALDLATGGQLARIPVTAEGRLTLQAVNDRIVVADSNTSLLRVLDCSRHEFVTGLQVPVQVTPTSATAVATEPRHVVVLNMVSNALTAVDAGIVRGDEFDVGSLLTYRHEAVEAFADLVGGLMQYLKDCLCDHLLVRCPPELEDKDLDLAVVSIRGGSVYKTCNFSRRHYVKSFPTVGYWLSLVPVLPALRELVAKACCAALPEVFGKYSTTGHDEADDRVDAQQVLRFLEIAQAEDPLSRLRGVQLGDMRAFLRGANTGEWGSAAEPSAAVAGVAEPSAGEAVIRPTAPQLIVRNLLMNPGIKRDLATDIAQVTSVSPEETAAVAPTAAAAPESRIEALVARVESLEAELATMKEGPGTA